MKHNSLRPFADVFSTINSMIEQASDVELIAIAREAADCNERNCWWAEYRAAQIVLPEIEAERARRQLAREREQRMITHKRAPA